MGAGWRERSFDTVGCIPDALMDKCRCLLVLNCRVYSDNVMKWWVNRHHHNVVCMACL